MFSSVRQAVGNLPESFAQGLGEQLVLVSEVFVKASMGQAGVPHNRRNGGAGDAFGANAPRGVLHDLLVDFTFVLGRISHGSL